MSPTLQQAKIKEIKQRAIHRIKDGRDPKIARWQAALESLLAGVEDNMVPGEIVAAGTLTPAEVERFQKVQLVMDLAPFVRAVFLPASLAAKLTQSVSQSVERAQEEANKVLVSRVHDIKNLLVAEVTAIKPGIDIFEDGSHVGSHNYSTPEECISDLPKIIWIHFKHRDKWTEDDYINYTEGWFYRSAVNKILDLPINASYSYIHHPLLINATPTAAIFRLIRRTMEKIHKNPVDTIALANAASLYHPKAQTISREGLLQKKPKEIESLRIYLEEKMFGLLKLLKGYDIVNFKSFSMTARKEFKVQFSRTLDEIHQGILTRL